MHLTGCFLSKVNIWNVNCVWVYGEQRSFSTQKRMFLWKYQSFWDRKCLDLRGTWTPNFRILDWIHIQPRSPCKHVSYHKMLFTVWQLQRYNIGHTCNAQKATHMLSSWIGYGTSCDYFWEKIDLNVSFTHSHRGQFFQSVSNCIIFLNYYTIHLFIHHSVSLI